MTNPPSPDTVALAPEDRSLLDGCLSARTGAWDAFVDRFVGLFAFVAARTARQRGLALKPSDRDDLVAEILVECLRNDAAALRSFAGRSSLATYLTVIARRVTARRLAEVVSSPPSPTSARHRRSLDPLAAAVDDAARLADREHIESLLLESWRVSKVSWIWTRTSASSSLYTSTHSTPCALTWTTSDQSPGLPRL